MTAKQIECEADIAVRLNRTVPVVIRPLLDKIPDTPEADKEKVWP